MSEFLHFSLPTPTIRQTPRHKMPRASTDGAPVALKAQQYADLINEEQIRASERGTRLSVSEAAERVMRRLNSATKEI